MSKPPQGYISQLPQRRLASRGFMCRTAAAAHSGIREQQEMTQERYDEWYKSTYGVEDLSDCMNSASSYKTSIQDETKNMSNADEHDERQVQEEMNYWYRSFTKMESLK